MEVVLRTLKTSAVKTNEGPQAMNRVFICLFFSEAQRLRNYAMHTDYPLTSMFTVLSLVLEVLNNNWQM